MDNPLFLHFSELPAPSESAETKPSSRAHLYNSLCACLFNSDSQTESEQTSALTQQPLHTYAILDAAKMPYILTGLLATSGLQYASLFQGYAQEELEEHAPYLVRLDKNNTFTQKLLPSETATNGLWKKSLGVFFCSSANLETLRGHFRKYTRIRNEQGQWLYFRFWEPKNAYATQLLQDDINSPMISVWLGANINCVLFPQEQSALFASINEPESEQSFSPLCLRQKELNAIKQSKRSAFLFKVANELRGEHPELWANTNYDEVTQLYLKARECGYTFEQSAFDFIRSSILLRAHDQQFATIEKAIDPNFSLSPLNRGKRIWAYINETLSSTYSV